MPKPRVPTDAAGNPRRRTVPEVIIRRIKDSVGIGSGARGRQVDAEVERLTRMRDGQSTDNSQ
jgi:hypothetical protein